MLDLATRMLVEWARKTLGTHLPQRTDTSPTVNEWDATGLPFKLALPSRPYHPGELAPFMTVHVSDVTGGFGIAKSRDKFWAEHGPILPGATSAESALLERYRGCAYHRIGSRRLGAVRNHPATLRTSHGNGGNKGMGWALDAGHAEDLGPELVAAGYRSLAGGIEECHEATGDVVIVVPHRVWSGKRIVDTSARVWSAIVIPVVQALGPLVCRIGYELPGENGGRPIPRSWDPGALFDDKGRRL